jgi:hypothetical protein
VLEPIQRMYDLIGSIQLPIVLFQMVRNSAAPIVRVMPDIG